MPEKTLRVTPSPTSSVKRRSLVEPSTASQFTIKATRRSSLAKSSMAMVGAMASPPGNTAGVSGALGSGVTNSASSWAGSTRCMRCLYAPIVWSAPMRVCRSPKTKGGTLKKVSTPSVNAGITGFNAMVSRRNASKLVVQTSCKRASAPACLTSSHGLCMATYSLTRSVCAITSRNARA